MTHTCEKFYFWHCSIAGLQRMDFYLYQSHWHRPRNGLDGASLPHWNWDNPVLAIVMDEEGRILFGPSMPTCGIDCQWGITRSEDLYQEDHMMSTYQEGKSGLNLSRVQAVPYVPGKVEAIARNEAGEVDRGRSSRNSRQGCGCSSLGRTRLQWTARI